jgi:hypothetical protein
MTTGTGQLGQGTRDRVAGTGQLEQGRWDRAAGTGQPERGIWDRTVRTGEQARTVGTAIAAGHHYRKEMIACLNMTRQDSWNRKTEIAQP